MREGDVIIALPSSGVHSNGFSLVRKALGTEERDICLPISEFGGKTLADVLLTPTKIYVRPILSLLEKVSVHGISHITGGGFYENVPRCIPDGLGARIRRADIRTLPVFDLIAREGNIPERDMFNTFNMGVGMVVILPEDEAAAAIDILSEAGEDAYAVGTVVRSDVKAELI